MVASDLLADVDRVGRVRLHPERELVGVDARRQLGVAGILRRVPLVQLVQQPQPPALLLGGALDRRLQVDDRRAGVAELAPWYAAGM